MISEAQQGLPRRGWLALGVSAMAASVAACGADTPSGNQARSSATADAGQGASASAAETQGSSEAPSAAHPDEATGGDDRAWSGTEESSQNAQGDAGVITAVRVAAHEGYDRVVIDTSGPQVPGWLAQWVDEATTQGKGDAIAVPGAHLLQVLGRGTHMATTPEDQRILLSTPGAQDVQRLQYITGLYVETTFESQFQVIIGTDGSQTYRVFTLESPTRLVIDVSA